METNNQFLQEVSPQLSQIAASESENSIDEELDELELEAIAGGHSNMADRARAAGMPVITVSGPRPNFGPGPAMNMGFFEALRNFDR
ncbi:hypothetical protein QUA42_07040 [Microcoleus sp. Pol11C2]|uniref:hypothetical protein n=1 Tax=Microcoleus sp. Pol11C2 TaxID=3055389 RepID=UPI002FD178BA